MKKISLFAGLLYVGVMFTACESSDPDFNPQTLGEDTETVTFEGSYWDALIDAPQYGGSQLYGADAKNYGWCDVTTQFTGYMTNAYGGTNGFSEGGSAISNYLDENISEPRDYYVQLAVPVSNGSKNFCVVYCDAGMKFADNKARVIKSMDFIGTTYFLAVAKNGDNYGYARALTQKGDYCNLEITGYKAGEATGLVTVGLAKDGSFLDYWITTDMTTLGAVDSLSFSMDSNDSSPFGMKAPMYVALDNVVIKK